MDASQPTSEPQLYDKNNIPVITLDSMNIMANDKSFHDGEKSDGLDMSQFEHMILLCERRFGKHATWARIKKIIFEINDEFVQRHLLEYCGRREDDDTDAQRHAILVDFVKSDTAVWRKMCALVELSAFNIKSRLDTMKELFSCVDDDTKQRLSYMIIREDVDGHDNRHMVRLICTTGNPYSYEAVHSIIIKYISERGKEYVMTLLCKILKHNYATSKTKEIIRSVIREIENE